MMDFTSILEQQKKYYLSGATRPLRFRIAMLSRLHEAISRHEADIAAALAADLHKHPYESYLCETGIVLDEIRFHQKHLARWMRTRRVSVAPGQMPASACISPEPYGVVLIMSPWNYPMQLCFEPLVGAISAGNCAVIKSSSQAPATSKVISTIVKEAFPPEYITVAECSREASDAFLDQPWDYIFFTGSAEAGKKVLSAAAKHLTPCSLELGGKSPVIVDETADLRLAARRIAFGKVLNAGQTCVAPDYLLIQESVREQFVKEYEKALADFFRKGSAREAMVRIISPRHYARVKSLLSSGKIALGGETDDETRYIAPTLLLDVSPDDAVMQQEIFGPILPVLTWNELSEAIRFIQSRPKPLALYLFTKSKATERRVFDSCSFGGGCVNDTIMHLANPRMPFGGVGSSGMGSYHGKKSFDTFTHERSILRSSARIDVPLRYMPYTQTAEKLLKFVLK